MPDPFHFLCCGGSGDSPGRTYRTHVPWRRSGRDDAGGEEAEDKKNGRFVEKKSARGASNEESSHEESVADVLDDRKRWESEEADEADERQVEEDEW